MQNWYDGWTDITYPIVEGMTGWPGQPTTSYDTLSCMHCGDDARVTMLHLSAHTGTHTDAPSHFLAQGRGMDSWPIPVGMGPARVADVNAQKAIMPEDVRDYERRTRPLETGERILFRTDNSRRGPWPQQPFDEDYLGIAPETAEYLTGRKIALVGVDYLSVGPFHKGNPQTHRALLSAGVWIVEGLDLRRVTEGDYEIICLPLKLVGSDGSPARVLLKES